MIPARATLLLLALVLLAACQPADNRPAVATEVAATVSAVRRELSQPTLLAPADGVRFASQKDVTLAWDWGRALAEDEYFDVRVWQAGAPDYGITWTRARSFPLTQWLTQQEAGEFHWSIAVIRGSDGQVEAEPGQAPPPRSFTLDSVVLQSALWQPTLLAPPDGVSFDSPAEVTLAWDWGRALAEDEHFDVRVWQAGAPEPGITWTRERSFQLTQWLGQQEAGEYHWSIAVIRGSDGQVEAEAGQAPAPRSFTLDSVVLPTPVATVTPQPTIDILDLPPGFTAQHWAIVEGAQSSITDIEFAPDGDLLVLTLDGRIYRLGDENGDGFADRQQQVMQRGEPFSLQNSKGMALHAGQLYVSDRSRVLRVSDSDGDGIYDSLETIVEALPSIDYIHHSAGGIAISDEGVIYITVGSSSDHGPLQVPFEASVLRVNVDGSELGVFATGIRNTFDLTFSPGGELFGADNAPDKLDNLLNFFPPEELNHLREGRNYGFPDVYGMGLVLRQNAGPTEQPVVELPTSSASAGVAYHAHRHFPPAWRDGVYVALHGGNISWLGKRILFIKLTPDGAGSFSGTSHLFAKLPSNYPVDVAVAPDGALFIVERRHGSIERVTWSGLPE